MVDVNAKYYENVATPITTDRVIRDVQCAYLAKATVADATLIAAPGANKRIKIVGIVVQNSAATANTVSLKRAAADVLTAIGMVASATEAIYEIWLPEHVELIMPEDTALLVALSAATAAKINVFYRIEEL